MSFACTLTKSGVKAFSRTLACLHKIGSEVSIEALADKLLMRTLAPSHAAYALVSLKPEFFEPGSFVNKDTDNNIITSQASSEPASSQFVKCKLHLKQMQLAFRHANLSQTHEAHAARIVSLSESSSRSLLILSVHCLTVAFCQSIAWS